MYFSVMTRQKVRFDSPRGLLSVEDLWDIPLESRDGFNLDSIAIKLHNQLESSNKSFVKKESKIDKLIEMKFETVKEIIRVKLMDIENKELREQNQAKRKKLLSLLEKKNDESLENMTKEQIMDELSKRMD